MKLTTHLHLVPRLKNAWSYTSIPPKVFMARCFVKHRGNFTFTFTFIPFSHTLNLCMFFPLLQRILKRVLWKSHSSSSPVENQIAHLLNASHNPFSAITKASHSNPIKITTFYLHIITGQHNVLCNLRHAFKAGSLEYGVSLSIKFNWLFKKIRFAHRRFHWGHPEVDGAAEIYNTTPSSHKVSERSREKYGRTR
jgi:hypothetical protein